MNELKSLDWQSLLETLKGHATSEEGRTKLASTAPLSSEAQAIESFNEIDEARSVLAHGRRPFMESLDLFPTWHQRLERNATLKPMELRDVRHFCLEAIALHETLKPFSSPWVTQVFKQLMKADEPLSAIDQIMTPDGDIRKDASETLFNLSKEKENHIRNIQNTLDKLVKSHDMDHVLQDKYVTNREGRWVLPIKSGMQHSFEGIIHASSQSKQTVFMEPKEIVPVNNRLRQVDAEIEAEVERLLVQLSGFLSSLQTDFKKTKELMVQSDVRLAQGQLASRLNASACEFSKDTIELHGVRHPLLVLQNEAVIPNSVVVDRKNHVLLLSGPNAGGKTVLLKSIGLAAQMARCGLPICTDEPSTLPFFHRLFVAVGDSQSVDAHLSTFAAHLRLLDEATQVAGDQDLILVDEICGATDPEEGAALARSFIQAFSRAGAFAVITSHLGALKSGWEDTSGVVNGSLEFDNERGPTYRFLMGVPGQSLAIQTAKRVGVKPEIIEAALEHLSPERKKYHESVKEIEKMKQQLSQLQDQFLEKSRQAEKERLQYERLRKQFEHDREQMLGRTIERAEKKVETMIQHAKVDEVFKRHGELQKVKADLPEVVKTPTSQQQKIESAEDFTRAFPPGTKVFAPSIAKDAVVQSRPNSKGEVVILAGPMRVTVLWNQLKPPHHATNPTQEILRHTKHYSVSPAEGDRVVDLRGLSVEEAISQLEIQLDKAALGQEDRIKIVHGHGTESLKKGIRTYLSRSVYVKKWYAGNSESGGGDGLTWAELA